MVTAFLDIETTSLYADTGMLVCAVLRSEGKDTLFFVESPKKEKDVLERLLKQTRKCDTLITFNGRSFDLPFLVSRGIVLGIQDVTLNPPCHIDLFEHCRKNLRFDKLSLDHIARVLGVEVETGLTGREVPHLYLTYLAKQDKELRDRIIEHCISDVNMLEKISLRLGPPLTQEGFKT